VAELVGRGREAAEQEKRGVRMLARFDVMNLGGGRHHDRLSWKSCCIEPERELAK